MTKKVKSFSVGDFVFAKVRGYSPWPAKITLIDKKKFKVYFYGTGQVANVKVEDYFNYLETKEKYANKKCLKRANFQTAVDQIEQAIADGDGTDLIDVKVKSSAKAKSKPKAKTTPKSITTTQKSVPNKTNATKVSSKKVTPIVSAAVTSATAAKEPFIRRSGRKIKRKLYFHEEFEKEVPSKRKAHNAENNVLSTDSKIDIVVKTEGTSSYKNGEDMKLIKATKVENKVQPTDSKIEVKTEAPVKMEEDLKNRK